MTLNFDITQTKPTLDQFLLDLRSLTERDEKSGAVTVKDPAKAAEVFHNLVDLLQLLDEERITLENAHVEIDVKDFLNELPDHWLDSLANNIDIEKHPALAALVAETKIRHHKLDPKNLNDAHSEKALEEVQIHSPS